MNTMKKVISFLLCAVIMMSFSVMSTNAAIEPIAYGDADADGDENIFDVTFVQFCVALLDEMDKLQFEVSDVDDNGEITIMDATMIQCHNAELIDSYPAGGSVSLNMDIHNFYCNLGDAVLTSNDLATFYADVYSGVGGPVTYSFYINKRLVKVTNDSYFSYYFREAGEYDIKVVAENHIGIVEEAHLKVQSVGEEAHTVPEIGVYYTNLYKRDLCDRADDATINVMVLGADEPYEYAFDLYDGDKLIASQIMSEDNTFKLHPDKLKIKHEYTLYVAVSTGDSNIYLRDVPVLVKYTRI